MSETESREESMTRIEKEIDAERARRPGGGYATRCERCRFWEEQKYSQLEGEDREGECHRYAPRIQNNYIGRALGIIAWATEEAANIEHDKDFDYCHESRESPFHNWPNTCAHDWCGEFQEHEE